MRNSSVSAVVLTLAAATMAVAAQLAAAQERAFPTAPLN